MFFKKVFNKINLIIFKFLFLLFKPIFILITKNKKDIVVFVSFGGTQYSDNPKAVSEYLHIKYPEINQVFLVNNVKEFRKLVPSYIICKKNTYFKNFYYLNIARVVVDNDSLAYANQKYFMKSEEQLFIETWHGDRGFKNCFKALGKNNYNYKFVAESKKIDYYLTGSEYAENNARRMFNFNGDFLKIGCPRNDIFFENKNDDVVRKKLNIDKNTKILLYAPTYRSYTENEEKIDFEKVIEVLEKKTKCKWVLVYRTHHHSNFVRNNKYIDGRSLFNDMSDILPFVDLLITDYSSCAGDFALSGKGVVLYLSDYENYNKFDYGIGFDINESPYLTAKNNEELLSILKSYSDEDFSNNSKEILKFYGCYENGSASQKLCDIIYDFLKERLK